MAVACCFVAEVPHLLPNSGRHHGEPPANILGLVLHHEPERLSGRNIGCVACVLPKGLDGRKRKSRNATLDRKCWTATQCTHPLPPFSVRPFASRWGLLSFVSLFA